jgi:hypothetical protein
MNTYQYIFPDGTKGPIREIKKEISYQEKRDKAKQDNPNLTKPCCNKKTT